MEHALQEKFEHNKNNNNLEEKKTKAKYINENNILIKRRNHLKCLT